MMTLPETLAALTAAMRSDEPTSARVARALHKHAESAVSSLREWLNELDGALCDAEAALDSLNEAEDADSRVDAHGELVASVEAIHDSFLGLAPAAVQTS